MDTIYIYIFQIGILLFSVIVHEVSHGLMALRLGDETAKLSGRLTLNPISHLDPIGSILVPLILIVTNASFIIGWAKPVPYNPRNLYKDYKYGPLKVALAGPASNIAVAIVFALIIRFGGAYLGGVTVALMGFVVFLNILLAVFNLLPIPPLDGSKVIKPFLPFRFMHAYENFGNTFAQFGFLGTFLFIAVFIFLLFPVFLKIVTFFFTLITGTVLF